VARPSLLVVNQYYAPDLASTGRYAAGLCSGLVERGWRVRVVCGQPSYSQGRAGRAPEHEHLDGVEVHRVSLSGVAGRDSIPRRFLGYSIFMRRARREATRLAASERPDVVMTFHNPPFVGLIGRRISRKFDVPFVYSPFDILPEVVRVAGWPLPDLAFRMWDRVNAEIHDAADVVIVLDESMKRVLERKGVRSDRLHVMSLWALPDLSDEPRSESLRREMGVSEGELLLLYAGNMGYMHSLDGILDAAVELRDEPIHFVCIGEGPGKSGAQERVTAENLKRVRILGYQPETRFRSFVASADAAFISIRPGAECVGMPSRALTFLSAGTPILALTRRRGSMSDIMASASAGWLVSNPAALPDILRRLLREPSTHRARADRCRSFYREHFGQKQSVGTLQRALHRARLLHGAPAYRGRRQVVGHSGHE
jgi:glycosyltransferase involved in cell wall biosynthesis